MHVVAGTAASFRGTGASAVGPGRGVGVPPAGTAGAPPTGCVTAQRTAAKISINTTNNGNENIVESYPSQGLRPF
jgi:hypothetical protein